LQVFKLLRQVISGIVVNKERALAEVHADYSTTTEIADALMQKADVPFRIGHHFASQLTDFGRGKGLKLHEIPYTEAMRIYQTQTQQPLPLTETAFREVISAEYMVFGRKGTGGPQLSEVNRMLAEASDNVAADVVWLKSSSSNLTRADAALEKAFTALAGK
jgi:argininosuccinate lyase